MEGGEGGSLAVPLVSFQDIILASTPAFFGPSLFILKSQLPKHNKAH